MKISDFSIENPVKVTVGVVFVWIFGLLAFFRIPIQLAPEVQTPFISIETRWSGASPQEVEKEIVSKQEELLQDIEGMTELESTSSDGRGEVSMEFKIGVDMSTVLIKVANKLDQVEDYPVDADEPVIQTASSMSESIAYLRLLPAAPSEQRLVAFRDAHPELRDVIQPLIDKPMLETVTVYALAKKHPEINDLIKDDPDVLSMRTWVEDNVAKRIARVPGVAQSEIYGGSTQELRVTVDPTRLAARQITIGQLRAALQSENADVSAGDLWEGKRAYGIRTLGRFESPEQIRNVIVTQRDGAPVYVRDIAEVSLANSKTLGIGHQRGVNSMTVSVKRQDNANVLEVMEGVREAVEELNATVLKAKRLHLYIGYDSTTYIEHATMLVRNNIFIGGGLSIMVLLLFLRSGRSTLVVALAIPISCIGTFLIIRLLGRSINVISMAGMSFAVGMVVDSAIVVLENIYSHYQRGARPLEAASRGTTEVWGAILASTLTTLAVFLPVIFIQQEAGQLFRDIAIAICAAVSFSLIVSLTVIPAAAARLLKEDRSSKSARTNLVDRIAARGVEAITATTRRLQAGEISNLEIMAAVILFAVGAAGLMPMTFAEGGGWDAWLPHIGFSAVAVVVVATVLFAIAAFRARRLAIVVTMIVLAMGLSWRLMPPAEYLPEGNKNLIYASMQPPPGYSIEKMMELGAVVEDRLRPYWEAEPGSPEAEALDGPTIRDFFLVARRGSIFMGARVHDPDRARELMPVLQRASSDIPGVISFANQSSLFARRMSGGRNIEIEITGPELERLIEIGKVILADVQGLYPPETETNIRPQPSLDLGSPEMHIRRNSVKASERDVSTSELGYAINALVDGAYAGPYWHEGKEIDLKIYGADEFSQRTQDVAQLPIGTPRGELVAIGDVADVVMASGPEMIWRVDRERAIAIEVRPGPDIALEDAMNTIDAKVLEPLRRSGELGDLYHLRLAGTADNLREMQRALSGSLFLALLITFLLIAALYESFIYPMVIMISVPMAAVGGFAALRLQNLYVTQRLDTLTMLGFIILIGTVVNNAILIVNQALNYIRHDGMNHQDAIEESVRGRIRPIFMSTFTTVLGMLPLVLFTGAGSELYRGLGSVVLGGLLVSTVFTLFLVPMLFSLMYESRLRISGRRETSVSVEDAATETEEKVSHALA